MNLYVTSWLDKNYQYTYAYITDKFAINTRVSQWYIRVFPNLSYQEYIIEYVIYEIISVHMRF